MNDKKGKNIVILGPTSSGKTGLAVKLAHKFNGEIVSADSRQVYKGMDIGTGKDLKDYCFKISRNKKQKTNKFKIQNSKFVKIPYHLIDVVSPKQQFDLAKYQKLALKAIEDILSRGKVPIIAGGSGLYLQAVVDNYNLMPVKPDKKLRVKLEEKTARELFVILKRLDPKKAKVLNNSEKNNKRRLVRLIEVKSQKSKVKSEECKNFEYSYLLIGLSCSKEILYKRIYKRLIHRLEKEGMVNEVKRLKKQGLSWKRLESFGLEYKYVSLYLQGKLGYDEMVEKLNTAIRQYAKRQMTWFRRWQKMGAKIRWVKNRGEAERLAREFLK
ncbi:tRNA (adenosine(37)-N6)-dimethylallyltransferase MiaA [Candidatus Falkowbacteria bacterium CG11_big_fil_rev_8_21_14_0_20_39_10]|uniref:tRNA dimethylallyltransferase n=1 Tax=Candidatus Falkowbacteria bacterium CG11_big_fil_rev_8_21_14_0_20_39_10 TaxID=1974570 RepID=A0A2M6KA64_9BACT|nr:MAG: tRNA (adenosine(37)-N6)-dimethylallyltransferase MiaA [Candidatus Falkowbacteria bacterium CG11_big_fil_rev_8_21_14_0_20_39_10]